MTKSIGKSKGEYYVYVYLDPRKPGKFKYGKYKFNCEPIYIGKGKRARAYNQENRNALLKHKIAKFGKPIIQIITKDLCESEAFELEKYLIKTIGRYDLKKGTLCNLTDGGEGPAGFIMPEERKLHLSKINMGHLVSEESRQKNREGHLGRTHSEATKKLLSEKTKCRILSKETLAKLDKSRRMQKGRKCSEESKRKMSKSRTGKKLTEEHKRHISEGVKGKNKGKIHSDEFRRRLSEVKKGRPLSKETKKKISISVKKQWKERRKEKYERITRNSDRRNMAGE